VVRTDASWTGPDKSGGDVNLIYIYKGLSSEIDEIDERTTTVENLLIPPVLINRLGWSRGYFRTIKREKLIAADVLERHVFRDPNVTDRYVDEYGSPVELGDWSGPVGSSGLASYPSVEDRVCAALAGGR
jgi:hypothetical protein